MNKTGQGVRDLNTVGPRPKKREERSYAFFCPPCTPVKVLLRGVETMQCKWCLKEVDDAAE